MTKKLWKCRQLVIGTGAYGKLPVMEKVRDKAERRKIKLLILPTMEAIEVLNQNPEHKCDPARHVLKPQR